MVKDKKESTLVVFAESALYRDADEELKAKEYLLFWKENLMRKLHRDVYEAVFVEESYHVRGPEFSGMLAQYSQIALKLVVRIKFMFELGFNNFLGIDYDSQYKK